MSEDLPVIIELVDAADKIEAFLSFIEQHIHSGLLATMEQVEVRFYRGDKSSSPKIPPQKGSFPERMSELPSPNFVFQGYCAIAVNKKTKMLKISKLEYAAESRE